MKDQEKPAETIQPKAPQATNPPQSPQPVVTPPLKSKPMSKGLLWGIIGGSIGLVLIVVIIVAFVVFSIPNKQDYKQAAELMDDFSGESRLLRANGFNIDSEESINDSISKTDKHFDELDSMKAMRDPEVKRAYDRYKKSYDELKGPIKNYVKDSKNYKEYKEKCLYERYVSTFGKTAEQIGRDYDSKNKECIDFLKRAKGSDNSKLAEFAQERLDDMQKMRDYKMKRAEKKGSIDSILSDKPPTYSSSYPSFGGEASSRTADFGEKEYKLYNLLLKKSKE
ncbi:hypothetical protein CR956_01860 [Candidatus Saccharibacteria bacterium]|nr:MAG: hypothetical protein CR956_01860 [Candidatus Saccharibacteria bacterium]